MTASAGKACSRLDWRFHAPPWTNTNAFLPLP